MIIVETPVKSIQAEIERLEKFTGPNSRLYARGAIEALKWILHGTPPPAECHPFGQVIPTSRVH